MIESVLVVDDDLIALSLCEFAIKNSNFSKQVQTAKNGREALEIFFNLEESKDENLVIPTLIFLDLNMPIMDGWDFLKAYLQKFATKYPEIKVCILSSTIDPEDFVKAGKYKIVLEFISKPLTMEILHELKKSSQLKKYFEN
jgi:CheY-like chemotaxis protein